MSDSHEIFKEALERFQTDNYFHSTEMSRDLAIPMTSLNYNMSGKRKWSADRWISVLLYLGAAKIENGRLVIETKALLSKPKRRAPI